MPPPAIPTPRTLLVFVDGLGWPPAPPADTTLRDDVCPHLLRLVRRCGRPIDASLGVPGLPQSATGQATLLCGVNAARLAGRHVEGYPGPRLRDLVRRRNLFSSLRRRGYRAAFANAYFPGDLDEVARRRRQSVTTVATLAAFGAVRDGRAMARGEAVYHDLTRHTLRARGYDGPAVSPEESAAHLLAIAAAHDFTLFEFFQTDLAGHRGDRAGAEEVLRRLDRFLGALRPFARGRGLLVLTSDHGNIEDPSSRRHTAGPVPFVARGCGAPALRRRVRSLTDVVPALLARYPGRAAASGPAGVRG